MFFLFPSPYMACIGCSGQTLHPCSCTTSQDPGRGAIVSRYWRLSESLHLLFVDDEPVLRSLMAERLGDRGFDVVEADSGERALELLDQFAFDIVITDLRMPGMDGTKVIEAARQR